MGGPDADLLVVGAGISGLTAAALAARNGLRPLVLESHEEPGGCAGAFTLGGYRFPAGATLAAGFEPGGLHDQVYHQLGLTPRAEPLEVAHTLHFDGLRLPLYTNAERWESVLLDTFPDRRGALRSFLTLVRELGEITYRSSLRWPPLPPVTPRRWARLAAGFRPEMLRLLPWLNRTVDDMMASCGLRGSSLLRTAVDAQLLIAAQCEADACIAPNGAIALWLYRRGAYRVEGGMASIAQDLADSLLRDGGAIRYHSPVSSLRRTGNGWTATLESGETTHARQAVVSAPVWAWPDLLGPYCSDWVHRRLRTLPEAWGAFVLWLALDARDLPEDAAGYHQTVLDPAASLAEGNSGFVTLLPPEDGIARVSVSTHTRPALWYGQDKESYAARKAAYEDLLLRSVERVVPDARDRVVFRASATPLTYERFTRRPLGYVGGLPHTRVVANFRALPTVSGLPGLHFCGDTVFPGQGSVGATLSGYLAYQEAERFL